VDGGDRGATHAQRGDASGVLAKDLQEAAVAPGLVVEHAERHARAAPGPLGEKDSVLRARDQGVDGPVRAEGARGGQVGERSRSGRQGSIVSR
jgi:hypothetical protein